MGTSERYADHFDRLMDQHINQSVTRSRPIGLSAAELDLEHDPARRAERPIEVTAWARYPEAPAHVRGRAIAWTSKAVHVEWKDADGIVQRAWVWANAVTRAT